MGAPLRGRGAARGRRPSAASSSNASCPTTVPATALRLTRRVHRSEHHAQTHPALPRRPTARSNASTAPSQTAVPTPAFTTQTPPAETGFRHGCTFTTTTEPEARSPAYRHQQAEQATRTSDPYAPLIARRVLTARAMIVLAYSLNTSSNSREGVLSGAPR
jgi:hypothetical protein